MSYRNRMEDGFRSATNLDAAERQGKALGRKALKGELGIGTGRHGNTGLAASLMTQFHTRFALADIDAQNNAQTDASDVPDAPASDILPTDLMD